MRFFSLMAALAAAACSVFAASNVDLVNGIAVIVGDQVITIKDIRNALADDMDTLARRYAAQPEVFSERAAELERAKLDELVENQLILQEFKRAGYVVPESYFEGRIEEEIKRRFGDRLTLTKTLQAEGITYETFRTRIREREILRLMFQQKVPREPLISPAKIERFYSENRDKFLMEDQVKLRMIDLTNSVAGGYDPKKLALEIAAKAKQGVPFEELARVYSQSSRAAEGGDRGWVEKRILRQELADVAFKLNPGEISDPVETPQGIFIMQVEDKKVSYTKSLSEVRDEIEAELKAQETKRMRKDWIDQLKSKAFVRYF